MRILIIRHGDPDYVEDTLTARGIREAEALSAIIPGLEIGECFVSPLGRAAMTAKIALGKTGIVPTVLPWLQEFVTNYDVNGDELLASVLDPYEMKDSYELGKHQTVGELVDPDCYRDFRPDADGNVPRYSPGICWDVLPGYYASDPALNDPVRWRESYLATHGGMVNADPTGRWRGRSRMLACYDYVAGEFDRFLADRGYVRDRGGLYRTEKGHEKTVTLFCHFGITAVLLSRLWDVSPYQMWHSLCTAPTSVTEIVTEERIQGLAHFRALRIGDTTHLSMTGIRPSFSARFCESYGNQDQKH